MVNQIAINLAPGRDKQTAIEDVCLHLEKFWARPMKRRLIASLEHTRHELDPLARSAIQRLARLLHEGPHQAT
uniref:formate dehydrogenase subunit delta n=1 Tax=uncultured Halomonas sp. TaxID=173971 RepID=UPI002636CB8C|nr:formate dehydrogenase subunit delta [uncultured Halomonas sp.]